MSAGDEPLDPAEASSGSGSHDEDEEEDTDVGASGTPEGASAAAAAMFGNMPSDPSSATQTLLQRVARLEAQASGSSTRFSQMYEDLRSNDEMRQIMALTELSEYLSLSSEDALVSFPIESFTTTLIQILEDPGHGDDSAATAMLLACRCLFSLVDILPTFGRIIVAAGGLPVLCAKLLNIEFIDVAELAVQVVGKIAEEQPLSVLKAGGAQAVLAFLDFFAISVQRQAVSAAATMLQAPPPVEVFETHIRPVLPTLATLLQHSDPQVLQVGCECWRRVCDHTVQLYAKQRPGSGKPKTTVEERNAAAAAVFEEMFSAEVLGHLLSLIANESTSPSPHSASVASEALYILAAGINYSDALAREVMDRDVCNLFRQLLLATSLGLGSGPQTGPLATLRLRTHVAVLSLFPVAHFSDNAVVEVDGQRLGLLQERWHLVGDLCSTALGAMVDAYEISVDPSVRSLAVSTMLVLFLTCQDHPEVITNSLDAVKFSCFLANLLLSWTSKSVNLVALSIVHVLVTRFPDTYNGLLHRHGVIHAVCQLAGAEPTGLEAPPSKSQLVELAAWRVLQTPAVEALASTADTSSTLGDIATQLRLSPLEVTQDHAAALRKLRSLLLLGEDDESVSAFEFTNSGAADALNAFLSPPPPTGTNSEALAERLRLLLDAFGDGGDGALAGLVRLCIAAVQRLEKQPLNLFPASINTRQTLPPHFREDEVQSPARPTDLSALAGGSESSRAQLAQIARDLRLSSGANSAPPSALKLLTQPFKVRIRPASQANAQKPDGATASEEGSVKQAHSPTSQSSPQKQQPEQPQPGTGSEKAGTSSAGSGSAASEASPTSSPQRGGPFPAARLRSYLASKVGRKVAVPSSTPSTQSSSSVLSGSSEPRMSKLLSRANVGRRSGQKAGGNGNKASEESDARDVAQELDGEESVGRGGDAGSEQGPPKSPARSEGSSVAREEAILMAAATRSRAAAAAAAAKAAETGEAVLLVEPLAPVCALEDYIVEKYGGTKAAKQQEAASQSSASGSGAKGSGAAALRSGSDTDASVSSSRTAPGSEQEERGNQGARAAGQSSPGRRRTPGGARARISLNGETLPSQMSLVQALVCWGSLPSPAGKSSPFNERRSATGPPGQRFLVSVEESEPEYDEESGNSSGSTRHLCGSLWGRIHGFGYEIVPPEESSASLQAKPEERAKEQEVSSEQVDAPNPEEPNCAVVSSEFERLVQRHLQAGPRMKALNIPRKSSHSSDGESGKAHWTSVQGLSVAVVEESLLTMLQLLLVLHQVTEYLNVYNGGVARLPSSEDFACNTLASKLLRQLGDPLALCTGSVPLWCTKLAGVCRFMFPNDARRSLHQTCSLGLGRALQALQLRSNALQESQRRGEETPITSVPRQKVHVQREKILESAVRVMNVCSKSTALLEVEYVGEVGTGSGPTLEFYAQVADVLKTSTPQLFRTNVPGAMLFPEPQDAVALRRAGKNSEPPSPVLERFRLLGQLLSRCLLDGRLLDVQLHPIFWRLVLRQNGPLTIDSVRDVDPSLQASLEAMRKMDDATLASLCIDGTLPGHPHIELWAGGASRQIVTQAEVDDYIRRVAEVTLVEAVAPQVAAFRQGFSELLPIDEVCGVWSEGELSEIVLGAPPQQDSFWTLEHLGTHVKASHGYKADSRSFKDLLEFMSAFDAAERRAFMTFATGAPSLPIGGFAGLRPPLTVVCKEAPASPSTPDDFLPSVMTCANYLKLPDYSSADVLRQKLRLAMSEGQNAFLLS